MAWFEGLSSLKGQLSNLAKGVLADDTEQDNPVEPRESNRHLERVTRSDDGAESNPADGWNDAFLATDTFIGQDAPPPVTWTEIPTTSAPVPQPQPESSRQVAQEGEEGSVLSKGFATLLSLGKTEVHDDLKALQAENKLLRDENESQSRDIRRYTRIIGELESMVAVSQDENSNLSTGMEELDLQHQQAIEQVLNVKEDTQKQYEQLQIRYAELESRFDEVERQLNKPKPASISEGTDPPENENEGNLEIDDLVKQLEERDKDMEIYENEIARLNELVETLNSDLETARESLPPIPENSEELELKVTALEGDNLVLREVRTNLETEVAVAREQVVDLTRRLRETNAMLKNQENVMIDYNKLTEKSAQQEQELIHNRDYIEKLQTDMIKAKEEAAAQKEKFVKELDEKNMYITRLEEGSESSSQFLQEENAKLNKKIASLTQQALSLDEQLQRAQIENEVKDKKLCELVFESNSLKEEHSTYKGNSASEIKKLESEINDLKEIVSKNGASDERASALLKENDGLKLKIQSLELELQSKSDNEELLGLEMLSLNDANQKLRKKLEEGSHTESILAEKDQIIESMRLKCKNLDEKFEDEKKAVELEMDSLRNSLSEFQINKDLSRETILELKKQLEEKEDELFKQNEVYFGKLSQLEGDYAQKDGENLALRSRIVELDGMISDLEKRLELMSGADAQLEAMSSEKAKLVEENKKLRNEIEIFKMTENQVEVLMTRNKEYVARMEEEDEKIRALQGENDELRRCLELKHAETTGYNSEIQRLNNVLQAEIAKSEKLSSEVVQISNSYSLLQCQMQEKLSGFEQMETEKNKQISALKQEVESLKNQLEYVSHLLKSVERGEGEGQGETPPQQKTCANGCAETQEELNRLTAALLKEQTENKILHNTVEELNEKLSKDGAQLEMLKEHLAGISESHTNDLMVAQSKINELTAKLSQADAQARTSSTAYTSANIRANQQVESLTQQVKLLTEHKEKLEWELSKAEDNYQKQSAAITNLQAVLHQFQRDKQADIEFETERIRQKLAASEARSNTFQTDIRLLQEQLAETKKGLAAANRLTEQLDSKSQIIESLTSQVNDMNLKLKAEEEKVKAAYTNVEGKVDRNLLKNLVIGYVCSPPNSRLQVLKVIAQVLDLSREERVKLGLEPGTSAQHQSLSEAFIKFLESESQPKPIVPLSRPNSTPPSRKTSQSGPGSLLMPTEELPTLPHFAVGRNSAGSILKDVLKERNT